VAHSLRACLDEAAIQSRARGSWSIRNRSRSFHGCSSLFTVRVSGTGCVVVGNAQETIAPVHTSFAVLLSPAFRRHASKSRTGLQKRLKKMGRRQTETSYQSEAAYLKSVLLWLQECWTEPAPRYYPFRVVERRLKGDCVPGDRISSDKSDDTRAYSGRTLSGCQIKTPAGVGSRQGREQRVTLQTLADSP
jgi:hypothetical protein